MFSLKCVVTPVYPPVPFAQKPLSLCKRLSQARKEKRVKIIVAVSLVICVVFTVFGSVFIQYNMLKFAAIAAQRIEWTLRESRSRISMYESDFICRHKNCVAVIHHHAIFNH